MPHEGFPFCSDARRGDAGDSAGSAPSGASGFLALVDRAHVIRHVTRFEGDAATAPNVGSAIEDLVVEPQRLAIHEALSALLSEEPGPLELEIQVAEPWGGRHFRVCLEPVRIEGEVELVSVRASAIDRASAMDRALRESRERFETLVQHAPDAITIFDADLGRFVMVNPSAVRFFGIDEEALLQLGPSEVSPPELHETAGLQLLRALEGETPTFEWVHLHADGTRIPCEIRLVRLPDPHRRLIRGSITDITERKRAEAERERMAAQLREAQKMEAVGQLTGGVAHDFNNLLTVILGNLELLRDGLGELGERPEVRELIQLADMATGAGERAGSLTQRLLAFSRRQALQPVAVDVGNLVDSLRALLDRTLGETIELELSCAEDLWTCRVDPNQLESAILNLALNARDAMPDGGRLRIATRNATVGPLPRGELKPGEYVTLQVEDEGTGIDAADVERVVEPFFSTKEVGRGSGLGLSMVFGFARQSGGDIVIESARGWGTTVTLFLPREAEGAEESLAARAVDAVPLRPEGRGERVLVVEDEARVRRLACRFLERLGYTTLEAETGVSAMIRLSSGERPDLIFSDIVLPGGMSGVELAARVRKRWPELGVLLTSGYAHEALEGSGSPASSGSRPGASAERGDFEWIAKPYTLADLARAVRRVLDAPAD